jgi:hypothetical protein
MAFCIPFTHKFEPVEGPGSGFTYLRCRRCGRMKASIAGSLRVGASAQPSRPKGVSAPYDRRGAPRHRCS